MFCATVVNFKLKVQIVNDLLGKNFFSKICCESKFQCWWLSEAAKLGENHSPKCCHAPVCQKNNLQQVLKKKNITYFTVLCNFKCIWAQLELLFFTFI